MPDERDPAFEPDDSLHGNWPTYFLLAMLAAFLIWGLVFAIGSRHQRHPRPQVSIVADGEFRPAVAPSPSPVPSPLPAPVTAAPDPASETPSVETAPPVTDAASLPDNTELRPSLDLPAAPIAKQAPAPKRVAVRHRHRHPRIRPHHHHRQHHRHAHEACGYREHDGIADLFCDAARGAGLIQ